MFFEKISQGWEKRKTQFTYWDLLKPRLEDRVLHSICPIVVDLKRWDVVSAMREISSKVSSPPWPSKPWPLLENQETELLPTSSTGSPELSHSSLPIFLPVPGQLCWRWQLRQQRWWEHRCDAAPPLISNVTSDQLIFHLSVLRFPHL